MKEKDKFSRNYSLLKNKARSVLFKSRFRLRLNHNYRTLAYTPGLISQNDPISNEDLQSLINRLKPFYLLSDSRHSKNMDSGWVKIFLRLQGDIHDAFSKNNDKKIADILNFPSKYNLFYGFENLCRELLRNKRLEDILEPELTMDSLITLCEAMGVLRIANPESIRIKKNIDADTALELIENELGLQLKFPNPFKYEYGIKTKSGIISYRAIQALYQAWKIYQLTKEKKNPKILEIGGGLGRTAYYANLMGIKDYTIVDIPISSVAQANFLTRTLTPDTIHLEGEPCNEKSTINLVTPHYFLNNNQVYDVILNADSLVEIDIKVAKEYLDKIKTSCNTFLSINHEFNAFTINELGKEMNFMKKHSRSIYWVRRGYVEEIFKN